MEKSHVPGAEEGGFVGGIPIRNIWLLLLYASELLRYIDGGKFSVEKNPDDIPDLVAELLARLVEKRIRRNLSYGYRTRTGVLGRVRGQILMLETECRDLLSRGLVACRFEELAVDTIRNRYVKAALETIACLIKEKKLAGRCKSLAAVLRQMGVVGGKPSRAEMSADRIGRNDAADSMMMTAARLAFDMALPVEMAGTRNLPVPERTIEWLRKLYERAVAGFYDVALAPMEWKVSQGKTLHWRIAERSSGIGGILPSMRTDIFLENENSGRRIIIDTKFNAILTKGWYREESLRSGYIYQMYAYLRSQEGNGDPLSESVSGILLHPVVGGKAVDERAVVQGHEIRFATVDLGASAVEIRTRLLGLIAGTPKGENA